MARPLSQLNLPLPDDPALSPSEPACPRRTATAAAAPAADRLLFDAICDPSREDGFLPIAEEAVRLRPGEPKVLLLAATAALLDRNCGRAQSFLKRFAPTSSYHLLRGLALAQENKLSVARATLECHGLNASFVCLLEFPGGFARQDWLRREFDRIFARRRPQRRAQRSADPAARREAKRTPETPAHRHGPVENEKPSVPLPPPQPAGLPPLDIDVPVSIEIGLEPLLAAAADPRCGRPALDAPS